MGMTRIEKIGQVSIKEQDRDGALYLSYWSAAAKKVVTQKLPTKNVNHARKEAAKLNKEILGNQAPQPNSRVRIPDAMDEAIKFSRSKSEHHRWNLAAWARYFQDWLAKKYPGLTYWADLQYSHVAAYIEYLRDSGKSVKTAEHYASVIAMTSRHWAKHHPRTYNRIEISHPWLSTAPLPEKRYLPLETALKVLELAHERRTPTALFAIALGAFAGLNLREIVRLRAANFDLERETLMIGESKNKHRERTIPLLSLVVKALKPTIKGMMPDEMIIKSPTTATDKTISGNLHERFFPSVQRRYPDLDIDIAPKDLRKTFMNLLDPAGIEERWQEAYVGHAEYSVIRRHYKENTVALLRENVVKPLEMYLKTEIEKTRKYERVADGVVRRKPEEAPDPNSLNLRAAYQDKTAAPGEEVEIEELERQNQFFLGLIAGGRSEDANSDL